MIHAGLGLNLGTGLGLFNGATESFSPFLPAGDPSLLENVDFRNGLNSGILTGWTQRGTGHTYDSRGFRASAGGLRLENSSVSTALQSSGSIILEVERSGIAFNSPDKNPTHSGVNFTDLGLYNPGGGYPTPRTNDTDTPYLFYAHENVAFAEERILYMNTASTSASSFNWQDNRAGTVTLDRVADRVPSLLDPKYATVILTWSGTTETLIVDGLTVRRQTTSGTASNRLNRIELCGGGDVPSRWWGDYAIRRLQISTLSMAPTTSATKFAILADSFGVRATQRADVTVDTVAEFDARQSDLAIDATRLARINQTFGNGNWGWWLQSLAYLRNRRRQWFTIYNAGYSGRGWRSDVGLRFTANQRSAVIAHNPNVLICFGSVNDVNLGDVVDDGDIVADITGYLTPLIAGCSSLTKVVWFWTFFTPESYKTNDTAAQYAEALRQRNKFATLSLTTNNGSAQPVTVQFVNTWDLWAPGGTQPRNYAIGSHLSNGSPVPPSGSTRSAVADGDVHPTTEGMARIAEIVWPYIKDSL